MSQVFYTSDLHLGHENILWLGYGRPFKSIQDHDEELICRWNEKVGPEDHVCVLGDFSYRSAVAVHQYLEQMEGHKHLIVGNHDSKWMKNEKALAHFESVDESLNALDLDGRHLFLTHIPQIPKRVPHAVMVYGHIHADKPEAVWPYLRDLGERGLALNASVDINNYEPVTFEELVENNRRWREGDAREITQLLS
ncbi:MAG: metallophosphoesterase family protein [Faecousia sp.]